MSAPISQYQVVIPGQTITASLWNGMETNIINVGLIPTGIEDASANDAAMQTTADPYPGSVISRPTDLLGEVQRIRFQLVNITGKTYWYEDPAITLEATNTAFVNSYGTLSDVATPAATAASLKVRLDHIVSEIKRITGGTNWYDAVTKTLLQLLPLSGGTMTGDIDMSTFKITNLALNKYRRPVLQWVSITTVDVESGIYAGTAGDVSIFFPDGNLRTVTSANLSYTRFDITRNASLSGTKLSGLRTSLSEATNTWYALYAVKTTDDVNSFVTVGDTVLPLQANYATLNSNFGSNGWVYLGLIRNGNSNSHTGDILKFKQAGNQTILNESEAAGLPTGFRLATGTATPMDYTYAAGTGAAQIPNNINIAHLNYIIGGGSITAGQTFFRHLASNSPYHSEWLTSSTGNNTHAASNFPITDGARIDWAGGTAVATIYIFGWIDSALGVGSNPLL